MIFAKIKRNYYVEYEFNHYRDPGRPRIPEPDPQNGFSKDSNDFLRL